jgi:hypothetical protein
VRVPSGPLEKIVRGTNPGGHAAMPTVRRAAAAARMTATAAATVRLPARKARPASARADPITASIAKRAGIPGGVPSSPTNISGRLNDRKILSNSISKMSSNHRPVICPMICRPSQPTAKIARRRIPAAMLNGVPDDVAAEADAAAEAMTVAKVSPLPIDTVRNEAVRIEAVRIEAVRNEAVRNEAVRIARASIVSVPIGPALLGTMCRWTKSPWPTRRSTNSTSPTKKAFRGPKRVRRNCTMKRVARMMASAAGADEADADADRPAAVIQAAVKQAAVIQAAVIQAAVNQAAVIQAAVNQDAVNRLASPVESNPTVMRAAARPRSQSVTARIEKAMLPPAMMPWTTMTILSKSRPRMKN